MGSPLRKVLAICEIRKPSPASAPAAKLALKFAPGRPESRGGGESDCAEGREDGDETETQRGEGSFRSGRSMKPSSSPGSLFSSRGSGDTRQGRSPGGSCHLRGAVAGAALRGARARPGAPDSQALGALRNGGREIPQRPKAPPFRYAFSLRPLQLPAALAEDFLPPNLTPSKLPAQARTLPTATAGGVLGMRRGSKSSARRSGPEMQTRNPQLRQPKAFTQAEITAQ